MRNPRLGLGRLSKYLDKPESPYPIQRRGFLFGAVAGLTVATVLSAPLAGFAVFVLLASAGLLWRRDEPPILVYCVGYQWIFVASGYFDYIFTGVFPSQQGPPGDLEGATFLSLLGFLAIALGVRTGLRLLESRLFARSQKNSARPCFYDVRFLFWGVIGVYTISWFFEIVPRDIAFNQAQIISNILSMREVLLCLLFLSIFQQRKGFQYGIAAAVFVFLPQSTSQHAAFSGVFIMASIALLREWRPWTGLPSDRRVNRRIVVSSVLVGAALLFMALVWQGGTKNTWRAELKSDSRISSPVDKLAALADIVEDVYSTLDWGDASDSLAERLSGTFYFSHTLNYVPAVAPHENGALTWRAVEHTFKPRFLFPDKPDLGSNSWLIWQYTGMEAAGAESDTSIGLTYMAEFYVDYGQYYMFVALFGWGLIIGLAYTALFLLSPSHLLSCAAAMVLLSQPFSSYEGEIAYMLGGLVQVLVVMGAALLLLGPLLHRNLLHIPRTPARFRRLPSAPITE